MAVSNERHILQHLFQLGKALDGHIAVGGRGRSKASLSQDKSLGLLGMHAMNACSVACCMSSLMDM